jgi:hypothetical protein
MIKHYDESPGERAISGKHISGSLSLVFTFILGGRGNALELLSQEAERGLDMIVQECSGLIYGGFFSFQE